MNQHPHDVAKSMGFGDSRLATSIAMRTIASGEPDRVAVGTFENRMLALAGGVKAPPRQICIVAYLPEDVRCAITIWRSRDTWIALLPSGDIRQSDTRRRLQRKIEEMFPEGVWQYTLSPKTAEAVREAWGLEGDGPATVLVPSGRLVRGGVR